LRQNAGRKTLGIIAAEFEAFKETFRDDRRVEDSRLQQEQKGRILGAPKHTSQTNNGKGRLQQEGKWDWRYTMRPCTTSHCKNFYTPFSNHLYAFYHTPCLQSSSLPLQTLCPSCSKSEFEAFENKVKEKKSNRCGWNEQEWNEWFGNVVRDREMEQEYWLKAQESVVSKNEPTQLAGRLEDEAGTKEEVVEAKQAAKKSKIRRWFGSMAV
jgi:hypothetical protein